MTTSPHHYDTKSALEALGVTETTLTSDEKDFLDANGYLRLSGILTPAEVEALRIKLAELYIVEKDKGGLELTGRYEPDTPRLANLVDKGNVFRVCITHPRVLAAAAHVLENDVRLYSLTSRDARLGQGLQALHSDWPEPVKPGCYQVCNSAWLIDDVTSENGATRIVPGSHLWEKLPAQVMSDPTESHPDEKLLVGPAGTVVIFNSHMWHGGTLNRTGAPRRVILSAWARRHNPQQIDQRSFLSSKTKAELPEVLRYLVDVEI